MLIKYIFGIAFLLLMFTGIGSGTQIVPLPGLQRPEFIQVDDRNIYITDGIRLKIFSRSDYKLKTVFGKKGEGPREFKNFILAYVQKDHIFVNSSNKVSYFSLEGKFIREKKTTRNLGRFKPVADKFVGYVYSREGQGRTESIYLFDSSFEKLKLLYKREHFLTKKGGINLIEERPPFFYIFNKRIYLDSVEGTILVFDTDGNPLKTIDCKIPLLPFTSHHKERFEEGFKNDPIYKGYYYRYKDRLVYPEKFPPIRMFHVADEKIYVMTNRERDGKNQFIIFNLYGKELKRIWAKISTFDQTMLPLHYNIRDGKFFNLVDNQDSEVWELHIIEIK